MAYSVPPLPYAYDALEPHIDKATMAFHHDKHHATYVKTMNELLEAAGGKPSSLEDVVRDAAAAENRKLFNNAAQTWNHAFFWNAMAPSGAKPDGDLAAAIKDAFGDLANLKKTFVEEGVAQFGSGWAWLVRDGSGLAVVGSANQDNPISNGQTPLLGVDVWEHSYYLKYQNRRPDYIDAWWNVVNWPRVAERY